MRGQHQSFHTNTLRCIARVTLPNATNTPSANSLELRALEDLYSTFDVYLWHDPCTNTWLQALRNVLSRLSCRFPALFLDVQALRDSLLMQT
jgi:hypothetical protein